MFLGVGEIEACKLAVIFLRSLVVSSGGVDFIVKTAKMNLFAISVYQGSPLAIAYPFSQGDSFVWRCGGDVVFAFVGHILCMCRLPEVGLCIVGGILVFVVDDAAVRDLDNLAVHREHSALAGLGGSDKSLYVEFVAVSESEPFMISQSLVVFGIDFGVPGAGEGNSAEGVAVARPAVEKDQREQKPLQPTRKVKCDIDFDSSPSGV